MLLKLRDFIKYHNTVSLQQVSREFYLSEEALLPMLEIWMKRNIINIWQTDSCKSSCFRCKNVFYRYIADS